MLSFFCQDILLRVIEFLPCTDVQRARVCRTVRDILQEAPLYLDDRHTYIRPDRAPWTSRYLCTLRLSGQRWPERTWTRIVHALGPQLQTLSLLDCNLSNPALSALPSIRAKNLTTLELDSVFPAAAAPMHHGGGGWVRRWLEALTHSRPKLRCLSLRNNRLWLEHSWLSAILLAHCKSLLSLSLQGNYILVDGDGERQGIHLPLGLETLAVDDTQWTLVARPTGRVKSLDLNFVDCAYVDTFPDARGMASLDIRSAKLVGLPWPQTTPTSLVRVDLHDSLVDNLLVYGLYETLPDTLQILFLGTCVPSYGVHDRPDRRLRARRLQAFGGHWLPSAFQEAPIQGLEDVNMGWFGMNHDAVSVSRLLESNAGTLRRVHLSRMHLDPTDASRLGRLLGSKCPVLRSLCIQHLRAPALTLLLHGLKEVHGTPLATNLTEARIHSVHADTVCNHEVIGFLATCHRICRFQIQGPHCILWTPLLLRGLSHVRILDMSCSDVTNITLFHLLHCLGRGSFPRLQEFCLDRNWHLSKIDNRDGTLAEHPTLRVLSCRYTGVSDETLLSFMAQTRRPLDTVRCSPLAVHTFLRLAWHMENPLPAKLAVSLHDQHQQDVPYQDLIRALETKGCCVTVT